MAGLSDFVEEGLTVKIKDMGPEGMVKGVSSNPAKFIGKEGKTDGIDDINVKVWVIIEGERERFDPWDLEIIK